MALATTLKIYMRQLQWQFHEARMTRVWNEIARLLNEEDDGVLVAFSANTYYGDGCPHSPMCRRGVTVRVRSIQTRSTRTTALGSRR
jgi:hypothetical protein